MIFKGRSPKYDITYYCFLMRRSCVRVTGTASLQNARARPSTMTSRGLVTPWSCWWTYYSYIVHLVVFWKMNLWCQVKLVKCMVQNLVVDISVNQIGGLCTLCFLEQVRDALINLMIIHLIVKFLSLPIKMKTGSCFNHILFLCFSCNMENHVTILLFFISVDQSW